MLWLRKILLCKKTDQSKAFSVIEPLSSTANTDKSKIKLPDISGVSADAVRSRIPAIKPGKVSIRKISEQNDLLRFVHNFRLPDLIQLQGQWPEAIVIDSGHLTLEMLHQSVANEKILSRANNIYTLRRPLLIKQGAVLIVSDEVKDLRFSREKGAFLVNSGELFVTDTRLTAWNERTGGPAWFKEGQDEEFRPFLLSWSDSKTWIAKSILTSFGYFSGKSYGLSLSSGPTSRLRDNADLDRPTGWIVGNRFVDMYYGFYSYEADDVYLVRNVYENNIIYGIDPHDRSERLVIAHNEVYGSKKKHGIIISREVNNSFIFSNYSHGNTGSGFMLDRSSVNNIVSNNIAINNGGDGITLFESGHNSIRDNKLLNNNRHGLHVRNSVEVDIDANLIVGNREYGIYTQVKPYFDDGRDLDYDPFTPLTTITSVQKNTLESNGSGAFSFTDTDYILLGTNNIMPTPKGIFRGQLQSLQPQLLNLTLRQKKLVAIRSKPESSYLFDQ